MSEETKLTHAAQFLLRGAGKAFEEGSRIRGIALVKDCLVLLGNGYERLTTKAGFTEKEIEDMKQPAEQPAESESKPGAGVVGGAAEPAAEQESAPGAGVVSKPEKSENKDGSGVV